jgi:hypothetical protein
MIADAMREGIGRLEVRVETGDETLDKVIRDGAEVVVNEDRRGDNRAIKRGRRQ